MNLSEYSGREVGRKWSRGLPVLILLSLVLISAGVLAAQSRTECPDCVAPKTVQCPQGYHSTEVETSMGTVVMCAPDSREETPKKEKGTQLPGEMSPPPKPPSPPTEPPAKGPYKQQAPETQQGPGAKQKGMLKKSPPKGVVPSPPPPPAANKLYVRYYGGLTTTGYTYMGGWLPCYAHLSMGGNLVIWERYPSGATRVRNFGWRPRGWNKFFFYGDQPGWHALTINVNGRWCNWIWIRVS